jgi:hypothetical protein
VSHAGQHITNVNVRRLHVNSTERSVLFAWDYPGSTLLRVRILRSGSAHAAGPDDARRPGLDQLLVYDGDTGSFRDTDVKPRATYHYTVFARAEGGPWTMWARRTVRAARPRWLWPRVIAAHVRLVLARVSGR